jgi:hypothetical protein
LLETVTRVLEISWPPDDLRRFAIRNLDRLARIERVPFNWSVRPLGPLLASIRYSPVAAERELLADFLTRASEDPCTVALSIMQNGLKGRSFGGRAPHWDQLPAHTYTIDWIALLDPARPSLFRKALYTAPRDERLRQRLHTLLKRPDLPVTFKDETYSFLWHTMTDNVARDHFVASLASDELEVFKQALRRLTDSKFARRGPEIIPHLEAVLRGEDAARRVLVLQHLSVYLGRPSVDLAADAAAPFLTSPRGEERHAAQKTLLWLQKTGWSDVLGRIAREHEDATVRAEAARLRATHKDERP